MLSRRSVRVKVMQLLYMLNRDEQLDLKTLQNEYNGGIWKTWELYMYQLYLMLQVAQCAERDASNRAVRLMPSESDKLFHPKLYTNPCTKSLANHVSFLNLADKHHFSEGLDTDLVWRMYQRFSETSVYTDYLAEPESSNEDHSKLLLELYRFLCNNDIFIELTESNYSNWNDDESLVVGAIKKTIKAMPLEGEFYKEFEPSDETVREFGAELLRKTCSEDLGLSTVIDPVLKNWDPERVSILDMIMIKMALCELMHFPTIPTKVTLNEYIEISKVYSTEKSKEFINGVLDKLLKKLEKEGEINKEGRGLVD
jgi:N utilization substance protein B